ncbi:MAG TPA: nucleotide exchange factor GrpE [Rhizomicrobium sp.]|jgi:molecular chaperone GrpE|nr:nucleotide exchange factor GrpE [Rhizomicrobium sp.]
MSDDNDNFTNGSGDSDNPHAAELAVLDALRTENAELKDRALRALADAENTRRIAAREKSDASQYAVTKFARDMVTVADNFARALASLPTDKLDSADPAVKAVIEGIEATERQLLAALERYGVKPIETDGAKFDPNLHQAIAEVPANGKPPGTIVDVMQTGYVIGDRLLRPSMVTVARKDSGVPDSPFKVDTQA